MKILKTHFVILTVLFTGNSAMGQFAFESSIGANYMHLNQLKLNDNAFFNANSNYLGANLSLEATKNDIIFGFDLALSNSSLQNDSIQTKGTALIGSLLIGRKFLFGDDIALKLFAGYSYGGFSINSNVTNDKTINFSSNGISGLDENVSINNSSHFLTGKIKTEFYDVIFVSMAYHLSLMESSWKGTFTNLNNFPSDRFSNMTVTIGYIF